MTTATPTIESSQSPSNLPLISICISTRITTFDLSLSTPFMIIVVLMLHHHHHPITFRKRDTQFFRHTLISPGLEFTNIRTGETQAGMRVQFCYIGSDDSDLPTEANKEDWITLLPGQPYTLDASITPTGQGRLRTLAEMESGSDEKVTTLKWPMVHRLLDGELYEIKVNDEARVKRWIEGDLGEILERSTWARTPILQDEVIESELNDTTRFEVKRPDRDGNLNWP